MKFFTFILSIIILVLSVMPCNDMHSDDVQKTEQARQTSDNHQNETDHCSPFCACSCCAHSLLYHLDFTGISSVISGENFSNYNSFFNSSLFVSIWQPPKIG